MIQHLPALMAVARHQNFTRAAAELGMSASAVSQAVRVLEKHVGVPLLLRTTRSVSVTEAGQRLLDDAGPAVERAQRALALTSNKAGEVSGRLRLNVPNLIIDTVIGPTLEKFVPRYSHVEVEVVVDDRFVDIVAARFDCGFRLVESVQRDMVTVRLTPPMRFIVVASPAYLRAHGTPMHPRELKAHQVLGYRSPTHGSLVPWDLERKGRVWKVPATASVSSNDLRVLTDAALRGLGLVYAAEPMVAGLLRQKKLKTVLEAWAPEVPGVFAYFPSRAQASPPLRAFLDTARGV